MSVYIIQRVQCVYLGDDTRPMTKIKSGFTIHNSGGEIFSLTPSFGNLVNGLVSRSVTDSTKTWDTRVTSGTLEGCQEAGQQT